MIIMGVDPGYAITGYGVISDSHGKLEVIDYGVISTHSSTPFEHRLLSVFEGLEALIERFNPAVMAVEELFSTITRRRRSARLKPAGWLCWQERVPVFRYMNTHLFK